MQNQKQKNHVECTIQQNTTIRTKELCYITLVRPLVEYSSIIWDPFTEANIWKLEMVQRRAARMVFSDYRRTSSVTPMLHHLQWPTLQERRAHAKVTMMYRIVNGLVEVPTTSLTTTISARGHGLHYLVPFARTQCYQRSFFPDTIRLWNSLPQSVVSCTTIDSFKRVRPVSGRSWVRSPTASYQRRYKNGTRCFLAQRSAYKDRSGFSLLSNLVQKKKRWIPSGMSGRE